MNKSRRNILIFIWHGFFLALTMSMLDFNTVFPALLTELTDSKIVFGIIYSIMMGVPLIFNLIFSHFLNAYQYKKKFLLIGIYLRGFSFLGMALFAYLYGNKEPLLVIISFGFWVFLFSISGGFAGLAFTEILGKLFSRKERGKVYAIKQFASSIAALLGGIIVSKIFSRQELIFPLNYSFLLLIGFVGLIMASGAFWLIKEPPSQVRIKEGQTLTSFLKGIPTILKQDRLLSKFILVENLASFSLMIMPFYIVYARDIIGAGKGYVGQYLLFQVAGTILSNFFWAYLSGKRGSRTVVRICLLLGAIIPLLALIAGYFGPQIYSVIFLLVGFVISGRRVGFDPYLLDIAPETERTIYLGIRGTLSLLVVLLPVIGGIFIELAGYGITFVLVSLIMLGAFFLITVKNEE